MNKYISTLIFLSCMKEILKIYFLIVVVKALRNYSDNLLISWGTRWVEFCRICYNTLFWRKPTVALNRGPCPSGRPQDLKFDTG